MRIDLPGKLEEQTVPLQWMQQLDEPVSNQDPVRVQIAATGTNGNEYRP